MPLKLHRISLISLAPIYWKPNEVKTMVLVSIALLSLLRSESDSGKAYIPLSLEDQEGLEILKGFWWSDEITFSWSPLPKSRDNHANNWANEIRQRFTEYLSKKGFAPWQWKYAQFDLWELTKQLTEPVPRGVLIKRCSANMLQIYRRTHMQRVIFIKILSCLLHICRTPLRNASGRLLLVT